MKKLVDLLLIGSVGLSLLLLGILFAGYGSPAIDGTVPAIAAKPAPPSQPAIDPQTWTELRTEDLAIMVQRLRERGFPPEFVRALVAAQLREAYAPRMKALDPDGDKRPFWKSYTIDPKIQMAQMQLHREQQKTLRALLGPDAEPLENINALYQGLRFDTVPMDKRADVQRILTEFQDARNEIFSSAGGGMIGQEVQKRLEALQKEQQAALGRVLTPQELEEWDVRNSDTARNVRNQLSAFNPSEAEFRSIYKLQAEFDERFSRLSGMMNPEEAQRRGEAQQQLNEQIKAMLGSVRASEFERASDFNYRQTSQLVARLELPPATTNHIYDVQKDIREKMTAVMRSNPPPAEREQQFSQLATEAETRVTAILGARGFEAYKQYGGTWLQSLRPRTPNSPPRPTSR